MLQSINEKYKQRELIIQVEYLFPRPQGVILKHYKFKVQTQPFEQDYKEEAISTTTQQKHVNFPQNLFQFAVTNG